METNKSPRIRELRICPIKALCPISLPSVKFTKEGLVHDREWALLDHLGFYINGKHRPGVHKIRLLSFQPPSTVILQNINEPNLPQVTFDLVTQIPEVEQWFQDVLELPTVKLIRKKPGEHGFLDDPRFGGPTIVSWATLQKVQEWFKVPDAIDRFRPNVVVDGVDAFWEDTLLNDDENLGALVHLGNHVEILGSFPIHRCVVPSRGPSTSSSPGAVTENFIAKFQEERRKSFVPGAPQKRLTGAKEKGREAYHLTIATVTLKGGEVKVGDPVEVKGKTVNIGRAVDQYLPRQTSRNLQRIIDAAFRLRDLPRNLYYFLSAVILLLPVELSAVVIAKPCPPTVRKPSSLEITWGVFKLFVELTLLYFLIHWLLKLVL